MTPTEHKRDAATRLRAAGLTFAAIGSHLGVTGERARQLVLPVPARNCRACGGAVGPRKQYHEACRPSERKSPATPRMIDLTHRRFGLWTVLRYTGGRSRWVCRCECGTEQAVRSDLLRNGLSRSCRRCVTRRGVRTHRPVGVLVALEGDAATSSCPSVA